MRGKASSFDGGIANFYNVQVFNRSRQPRAYGIDVVAPAGAAVTLLGVAPRVGAHDLVEGRLLVTLPRAALSEAGAQLAFEVRMDGRVVQRFASSFVGPPRGGEGR